MSVTRSLATGVTALLVLGAAATGAAAQETSVDVTAAADPGSRQFFVEDLAGNDLTRLELGTTGQGQPFQTRVADNNFTTTTAPFTASAEMTNLYKTTVVDGVEQIDYATKVGSDKLSLDFAGAPTDVAGVSLGAIPQIRLTGLLPTCRQLPDLLPEDSPLLGSGGLLNVLLDPLNGLLNTLGLSSAAKPLCSALGGAGTTPLPIDALDEVLLALDEQVVQPALDAATQLPVSVTGSTEPGAFTNPSFLGDGAADPAKTAIAATTRKLLQGSPNSALELDGLVSSLIDGLPLFPALPGGDGALTSVSDVVAALQGSADTAAVGNALAGLSAGDQTGVLSGLAGLTTDTPVATLADTVLQRISGTYRSFPRLNANLAGAEAGTYTGTMTVTFVQE